jgi:hypothetical protein
MKLSVHTQSFRNWITTRPIAKRYSETVRGMSVAGVVVVFGYWDLTVEVRR